MEEEEAEEKAEGKGEGGERGEGEGEEEQEEQEKENLIKNIWEKKVMLKKSWSIVMKKKQEKNYKKYVRNLKKNAEKKLKTKKLWRISNEEFWK